MKYLVLAALLTHGGLGVTFPAPVPHLPFALSCKADHGDKLVVNYKSPACMAAQAKKAAK